MTKWKAKEPEKKPSTQTLSIPNATNGSLFFSPVEAKKENISFQDHAPAYSAQTLPNSPPSRMETFPVDDPFIQPGFDLALINHDHTPIPLDPLALNEAKLICREALTLITEEAARLVNHPELAYAEHNDQTGKTKMKRPNYAYPEILKARLPMHISNDAADDSYSRDAAALKVQTFAKNNDLFSHLVGDVANPYRKYSAFVSLDLNDVQGGHDNVLCGLSLHAYHHHMWSRSSFSKDSTDAIGAIGFRFARDKREEMKLDGCCHHVGKPRFEDPTKYPKLELLSEGAKDLKKPDVDITKIEIYYVPGSGRIAGL
jgi:hypothetical protein